MSPKASLRPPCFRLSQADASVKPGLHFTRCVHDSTGSTPLRVPKKTKKGVGLTAEHAVARHFFRTQSVLWSVVLQLSQRESQSWSQLLVHLFWSPPKRFSETALAVQLFEHSLVQTSFELLVAMLSHCVAQVWLWVCTQVVVSVAVQFALHEVYVVCAQACSTDVAVHVVLQS